VPPAAAARDLARHWTLDPAITFLNHGSFGACPRPVLEAQQALREQLEREPARFFNREAPRLLAAALEELAQLLNAPPAGLAFVRNVTTAINSVLRSVPVLTCPAHPGRLVRISAQAYNEIEDYERLAAALRALALG